MTTTKFLMPSPSEYRIGYAYPTSPLAKRLKRYSQGCWFIETVEGTASHASLQSAITEGKELGLVPHRWSWDHPLNAQINRIETGEPK